MVTASRDRDTQDGISSLTGKIIISSRAFSAVRYTQYDNTNDDIIDICLIVFVGVLFAIDLLSGATIQTCVQRRWYKLAKI